MQTGDIRAATERILKLRNYPRKQTYVLAALEDLQAHFGSLPKEALLATLQYFDQEFDVDNELSTLFHTHPDDSSALKICTGPLCNRAGSIEMIATLEADENIAIEKSHCLGGCSRAPVAVINHETIFSATTDIIRLHLNSNPSISKD